LNKLSKPVQVVVVCGRNEALRETLAKMSHRHPTQVLGFVSNMQDLMTVAELIISKPGGLTTSEALALGRPLLILNPIPGQEAANSDFLLEHGAAAKINRVEDLPSKLDRLLGSEKLAAMASVARSLGRPGAALNICQEVVQLLESEKKEKTSLAAMPGLTPASLKKSSISDGHSVLLYDSLGSQSEDGASWHIDVHGRVFSRKPHPSLERLLARALRLNLEKMKEDERRIFAERAGFFLEDSGKLKPVHVSLGSSDSFSLRSGQNGHFRAQFPIHHKLLPQIGAEGGILEFQASANPSGEHTFAGSVHLLPPTGLSIISDLDDTIKATDVHDRRAMISNTFCSEFRPVPGMADVYQAWAREAGASFHYVSASPWQLYMALRDFTKSAGFPAGTFHLRRVRLKDLSVLTLFASPALHKRAIIAPMLLRYPQRRFILVGDTCGGDPEIYGQLARRFPDQVSRIYVHQTSERLAKQGRLAKAFRNIPTTKWQLFRDPSELPRIP
jgi:phosphatidate phosphatase APP1